MWRERRHITGQVDYILGSDRRNFLNVGVREYWVTTNHQMVLECLRGSRDHQNRRYRRGKTIFPIIPPEGGGRGVKMTSGSKNSVKRSRSPRVRQRRGWNGSQRTYVACHTKGTYYTSSDQGTNRVIKQLPNDLNNNSRRTAAVG